MNNINTSDIIDININNLGEVTAFLAIRQNEFEKYDDINVDIDKVNKLIN